MNIGIIGLGLIGGSMAKAVKQHTHHTVLAQENNPEAMVMAKMSGAVDEVLESEKLSGCDLILLAIPPEGLLRWATENAPKLSANTVVVDLCGVKRRIHAGIAPLAAQYGFSYVGGHPMAGKEVSSFANADAGLFAGASMILTPDERSDIDTLDMLKAFFLEIGFGSITFSTPDEHDRIIAYTSQLAHVASSAYIKSPSAQRQMGFSAGSFRDMTRVARLDEDLWTQLFLSNADYLSQELQLLIANLAAYANAISAKDAHTLCALLKEGRELKSTAGGT